MKKKGKKRRIGEKGKGEGKTEGAVSALEAFVGGQQVPQPFPPHRSRPSVRKRRDDGENVPVVQCLFFPSGFLDKSVQSLHMRLSPF